MIIAQPLQGVVVGVLQSGSDLKHTCSHLNKRRETMK